MPEPVRVKIKRTIRGLPLLLALAIGVELLWSERVWMMLIVALGGLWLLEYVWMRALARGLRFKRELRYGWAQVGDQLEERFTLSNRSALPALWVQVTDHSNLDAYDARIGTGVAAASETIWRNKHICARRGAFHLGPTLIATGTPFGLYAIEFEYAASDSLLVMPPIVPLPEITVAPGGRAYEGRQRASTLERTVNANGVRQYMHGDPFKTIHWRSVAHVNELMVRTFASTPAGDWWIWLDLDESAQAGEGENSTTEHAIILAASLAERGLRAGRAVGLAANANEPLWLAPQTGEFQRMQILRALATIAPVARPFGTHIEMLRQAMDRSASVIFITPAVEGAWMNALWTFVSRANLPTVILLDRASYGASENARAVVAQLAQWGIPHFVVTRDLMDLPEARPGHAGEWDFRVSATGRAIARTAPSDSGWRTRV